MSDFGVTGPPPARLSVSVVSAGRVRTAFGAALERRGHVVSAVVARSERSRELAARRLPEARLTDPVDAAGSAELVILAVPDAALPGVVAELASADAFRPGHIVVHVAGAVGAEVLRPAADAGAVVVAAHPAMTFAGGEADVDRMEGFIARQVCNVTVPVEIEIFVTDGGTPSFKSCIGVKCMNVVTTLHDNRLVGCVNDFGTYRKTPLFGTRNRIKCEGMSFSCDKCIDVPGLP